MHLIYQNLSRTLQSMSFVSAFCKLVGDWSARSSVQLFSLASGISGEASEEFERVSTSGAGLTGNTESGVSVSGLSLDGKQVLDDSVAFRFSAGKQNNTRVKSLANLGLVHVLIRVLHILDKRTNRWLSILFFVRNIFKITLCLLLLLKNSTVAVFQSFCVCYYTVFIIIILHHLTLLQSCS